MKTSVLIPKVGLDELQTFVRSAAGAGTPVHEMERGLWRRLLQLGYQLQGQFFALVGDGDQGETVTLVEGQVVRRLPVPHQRPYQSVFGPFELDLGRASRMALTQSRLIGGALDWLRPSEITGRSMQQTHQSDQNQVDSYYIVQDTWYD